MASSEDTGAEYNAGSEDAQTENERSVFQKFTESISRGPVHVRVHDIQIRGNKRTKDWVIEAILDKMKNATTFQEMLEEATKASQQIQRMGVFDKCVIKFDVGPVELPGTTNVIVELVEAERPFSCNLGLYSKPETRNWSVEGVLKWKNLLGYGETWDGTGCYGWTSENSVGVSFPRFRTWPAGMFARVSMLTQDWHKYSSYKEIIGGFSVGLTSDTNHELSYNCTWRNLVDHSHRASNGVRGQLGHGLLSALKYGYRYDVRDSTYRPTRGYAFATTLQVAGLGLDSNLLRFIKQEIDIRFAVPLGFLNSALNFGASAGFIIPWGPNFMDSATPLSDRFFMGGHTSLIDLRGPCSLLGFRTRGLGPNDIRRLVGKPGDSEKIERDTLGGDIAVNTFADLSFDLPLKALQEYDIHGHTFACAGNVMSLADRKNWTVENIIAGFRSSAGVGIVIPTKMCRLEINYCRVLRQQEHDKVKNGLQFCFSF